MKRPSVDASLRPLKSFQRRTVEHAFHRLFTAKDSTGRFLVADEVGLGKTLVARGIIARTIDHLWTDVERIDIVYICSNASIARANLPKLKIGGAEERSFALATRLTMLATELARKEGEPGLIDSKLNFVSFTPGTSFNMGQSAGQRQEREVLFQLLDPLTERRTALMNFLQGWITDRDDWRWYLKNRPRPIEDTIRQRFEKAFRESRGLNDRFQDILGAFRRYRVNWPDDVRYQRDRLISELRRLLAGVCVRALEPDLVIMDEFQRFKSLLDTSGVERDPAAHLAHELFQAKAHDGKRVRTLLLSATPYKLYTVDAEIEQEDHYEDFLATTRFLLGDEESRVEELKRQLSRFGSALKCTAAGEPDKVERIERAKREVEGSLKNVMARTERVTASEAYDAMVAEVPSNPTVTSTDVRQYLAADALFRAVGDRDPMPFWKSAPYLAHFMRGYRFNELLEGAFSKPTKLVEVLQQHEAAFLKAATIRRWDSIEPGNAKLRELVGELIDDGTWRLLWMPPTLPYWPLEGPFRDKEKTTKRLLFSAWNMVPDVVSAVLSYEAERLMTRGPRSRVDSYERLVEQQRPLLRLTQPILGRRSRHRLLLLLLPCLRLADEAHPLDAPPGQDCRAWVRSRVDELLSDAKLPNPQEGSIDDRWDWIAPLLIDPELCSFLRAWANGELPGLSADKRLQPPNPEVFGAYVQDLLEVDPRKLGRRPPYLAELLTDVAIGSPAILAARSLRNRTNIGDGTRRRLAVMISLAFWSLFNQPAVITLMRQLASDSADASNESAYWRLVLRYCQQGNLQAVLDEQWHLLWDQESWSADDSADETAERCARKLIQAVRPLRARVHARFFNAKGAGGNGKTSEPDLVRLRLRTAFALRFGHIRTDEGEPISQDDVRDAFNSPFRPFVLTSTSIGQEGLDFHPWCHRLVHWNLPGNPVDLEQREGRIHRYKGHAIRRNVAARHAHDALTSWKFGDDIWRRMFELADQAARASGESDLVPFWIAPGEYRVQRHVPQLPYTTEIEAFNRLKRQLAAYRVVFGQPRQEELVTLLDRSDVDVAKFKEWAIDLSPPEI
ncbi:MAG: helicase-related protein [Gemmatimonadota bacterium]|nr:helicase-related protein [Gemmatimonadota bacterium]